jgi:DNA-binding NtrC family response regulator
MPIEKVILAESDDNLRRTVAEFIRGKRIDVAEAGTVQDVYGFLGKDEFDLIFIEAKLPECKLIDFLGDLNQRSEKPLVVPLINGEPDSFVLESIKNGAFDYLSKPFSREQIEIALHKAGNYNQISKTNVAIAESSVDDADREILGESQLIDETRKMIKRVAQTQVTVLIQGESGTGKELVARALHSQSPRAQKPFIKINCAALPETLIESEFFGHEKGAFTGAVAKRQGRFELAHGGTILLDEISEISLAMQAKLLRVLQEQEFERVGGSKTIKVDVRVIATTNRDLEESAEKGEFRQDLFFRLNVIPIYVPPLRDRIGDVRFLAEKFREFFVRKHGVQVGGFSDDAISSLSEHEFPGNVRELQNVIERAVILCDADGVIKPEQLNLLGQAPGQPAKRVQTQEAADGPQDEDGFLSLDAVEKKHIILALGQAEFNRTKAAELLGMNVRTLRNKINTYRAEAETEEDLAKLGEKD